MALCVSFLLLRPLPSQTDGPGTPRSRTFDLAVTGGVMSPDMVVVGEGDLVKLRISSAEPTRLHLHGYDLDGRISGREPATFSFEATVTGRFVIEDHGSERVLGSLVVLPR